MNPVEAVLSGMASRRRMQREDEDEADRKQRRTDEQEDRANRRTDRDFTMAERARAVQMRADMGAAAAPVAVDEREQPGPLDPASNVPGAASLPAIPMVRGQSFISADDAAKAAAEMNTPQAVAARQAQVMAKAGEVDGAQKIRTGAMQEQSARFKLNADERAELDARFNADLESRVNSWETLDAFASDSHGDGMGGKLKIQTTVSPDGKSRVISVLMPDGTAKPTGQAFPNTADGLALAKVELSKMSPEKKLAHLYQKEQMRRQAAQQESTERYQDGMLKATKDRTAAGIENAGLRTALAQQRAGGGAGGANGQAGMTLADLKDGHKGIASTLNADWKAQIDATVDPAALKAIKVSRENEIATVQRLYTGAMSAGFGLTPEQAIVAFRSGTVGTQSFTTKDGKKVSVEGVQYGGRFIPLADNPGALPEARPPAAPAAAPGAPAAPAAPASEAPPQRPRPTPTVMDFSGGTSMAGKRVEQAKANLPALEQAVQAAQQKVKVAAAQGPMAVAAARDELSNARTALVSMQARAGQ